MSRDLVAALKLCRDVLTHDCGATAREHLYEHVAAAVLAASGAIERSERTSREEEWGGPPYCDRCTDGNPHAPCTCVDMGGETALAALREEYAMTRAALLDTEMKLSKAIEDAAFKMEGWANWEKNAKDGWAAHEAACAREDSVRAKYEGCRRSFRELIRINGAINSSRRKLRAQNRQLLDALRGANELFGNYGFADNSPCVRDRQIVADMLAAIAKADES